MLRDIKGIYVNNGFIEDLQIIFHKHFNVIGVDKNFVIGVTSGKSSVIILDLKSLSEKMNKETLNVLNQINEYYRKDDYRVLEINNPNMFVDKMDISSIEKFMTNINHGKDQLVDLKINTLMNIFKVKDDALLYIIYVSDTTEVKFSTQNNMTGELIERVKI